MFEIVIISGKGGTGKTSITAGLAALGPDKVLADCDVDAADLHLILEPEVVKRHDFFSGELAEIDPQACIGCGLCYEKCRYDAIKPDKDGLFRVSNEHCEGCGLCEFVCPVEAVKMNPRLCGEWSLSETRFGPMVHAALGIGEENSGKLVTTVRLNSREAAEKKGIEVILTDGPPGIGCPVIASLTNTDLALIVTEPTISGLHDLERVNALVKHFKIRAMVLINKYGVNPEMAERILDYCRANQVEIAGVIDYDPAFTRAQIAGQSVAEYADGRYRPLLEKIWGEIMKNALELDEE